MKKHISLKSVIFSILFCLGIGGLSSFLTKKGIQTFSSLRHPHLSPPPIVFPIIWTILQIFLGIGFGRIISIKTAEQTDHERAISAFSVQNTFFFCWMIWFFGLGWYGFSAIWLIGMILSIIWTITAYTKIDQFAAWFQLPYLVWCLFALYLNIGVWVLNR